MDMSTGEAPLNVGACHLVDCQVTGKLEEQKDEDCRLAAQYSNMPFL